MVVGVDIKGDERLPCLGGALLEKIIKKLFPGRSMNARRPGQHAVEIEQNRVEVPRRERGDDFHMASCLAIEEPLYS
jgi:hypothetical protein